MKRYIRNTSPEELQKAIDEYTAKQKEFGSQLDDLQETVKRRSGLKFRKRGVESKTEVDTYRNKRNPNKYVEVHRDGYGHRSAKQYMHWDETDLTNPTGDGNLHRWSKGNMDELLDDYEPVESDTFPADVYDDAEEDDFTIFYDKEEGQFVARGEVDELYGDSVDDLIAKIDEWAKETGDPYEINEFLDEEPFEDEDGINYGTVTVTFFYTY